MYLLHAQNKWQATKYTSYACGVHNSNALKTQETTASLDCIIHLQGWVLVTMYFYCVCGVYWNIGNLQGCRWYFTLPFQSKIRCTCSGQSSFQHCANVWALCCHSLSSMAEMLSLLVLLVGTRCNNATKKSQDAGTLQDTCGCRTR